MGLCYAAAASALTCAKSHEFCRLAPLWQAELLVKARRLEAGWQVLHAARPLTARKERPEPPRTAAASHIVLGELLFAMGRVDRAIAEIELGLRIGEQCGVRPLRATGYVLMVLGALRRADMRTCHHFVDKLTGEALLGYFGQAAGAWVTAQTAEAAGGVNSAARLIAGIVTNPRVLRQLLVSEPAAVSWLVRTAQKLDDHELAETSARAAAEVSAQHPGLSVLRGSALHAAGLLEADSGKLHEAAHLYPDRWCEASAREDVAALQAKRRSERNDAIHTLESALSRYTEVGATRDASRVVNKLRDFGVRRGTTRAVGRDGVLPGGLTNTEFAVADLVSQGHTNSDVGRQLFISQHTVAFHLKKVYQKMNITSRVELAAIWQEVR